MNLYHQNELYLETLDSLLREIDALQSSFLARKAWRPAPMPKDVPVSSNVDAFLDQFVALLEVRS